MESNTAIFVTSCWQRNGTEMFFFHQKICRSSSNAENEKTMVPDTINIFQSLARLRMIPKSGRVLERNPITMQGNKHCISTMTSR